MLCDEMGNLGKIEAFLMASTLMRGFGLTLWSFFQNPAQLQVYGKQASTLVTTPAWCSASEPETDAGRRSSPLWWAAWMRIP